MSVVEYMDTRENKSRVHTIIISSGSEEVKSMKLLLYGEQVRVMLETEVGY